MGWWVPCGYTMDGGSPVGTLSDGGSSVATLWDCGSPVYSTEGEGIVGRWVPWGKVREVLWGWKGSRSSGSIGRENCGMEWKTMGCALQTMGWDDKLWDVNSVLWDGTVYYGM